jgi:hypothetical protein
MLQCRSSVAHLPVQPRDEARAARAALVACHGEREAQEEAGEVRAALGAVRRLPRRPVSLGLLQREAALGQKRVGQAHAGQGRRGAAAARALGLAPRPRPHAVHRRQQGRRQGSDQRGGLPRAGTGPG